MKTEGLVLSISARVDRRSYILCLREAFVAKFKSKVLF